MSETCDKNMRKKFMALNALVRQGDCKLLNPDDYIYASISQPPIKVLDKHGTDDAFKWDVECPNCKRKVNYGKEIFMVHGFIYCSDDDCRQAVWEKSNERYSHE